MARPISSTRHPAPWLPLYLHMQDAGPGRLLPLLASTEHPLHFRTSPSVFTPSETWTDRAQFWTWDQVCLLQGSGLSAFRAPPCQDLTWDRKGHLASQGAERRGAYEGVNLPLLLCCCYHLRPDSREPHQELSACLPRRLPTLTPARSGGGRSAVMPRPARDSGCDSGA